MPFFIVRVLSILGLVLLAACGDDDTPDESDGSVDSGSGSGSGSTDAATTDSSIADKDGGGRTDAGGDAGADAAVCPLEHFPLLDFDDDGLVRYCARRVPLSECPSCPESLSEFSEDLTCVASGEDAGVEEDGGADGFVAIRTRSEGCGSVQFHILDGHFDGYYNFDPQTGELIGAAVTTDDVIQSIPGCACDYLDTWVAGEVRASCANETVTSCRR